MTLDHLRRDIVGAALALPPDAVAELDAIGAVNARGITPITVIGWRLLTRLAASLDSGSPPSYLPKRD